MNWADDEYAETYGISMSTGCVGALYDGQPKGWVPPARPFNIGFHVAAPGPSNPEPAPVAAAAAPARKPRAKAAAKPARKPKT